MKKPDYEKAIRAICHQWRAAEDLSEAQLAHPSFSDFKSWMLAKGYGSYLEFRSTQDADAELWFDQEFKQTWRN